MGRMKPSLSRLDALTALRTVQLYDRGLGGDLLDALLALRTVQQYDVTPRPKKRVAPLGLRTVAWHEALLSIEKHVAVVVLLTGNHPTSTLFRSRVSRHAKQFQESGYDVLCVNVDENCASHPELAASWLPQLRVFERGELVSRHIGVREDDYLQTLVG